MSKLFDLSWRDLVKGLIMAVGSAVLTALYQAITNGGQIDWNVIGTVGISAAVAYLIKNVFTDESGKLGGKI